MEIGCIYAVLSTTNLIEEWRWALFLPDPQSAPVGSSGTIFSAVSADDRHWHYERASSEVAGSGRVVLCAELTSCREFSYDEAIITIDHELKDIPIPSTNFAGWARGFYSCKTFFLNAIRQLHDLGMLHCPNESLLEHELKEMALAATPNWESGGGITFYTAAARFCR